MLDTVKKSSWFEECGAQEGNLLLSENTVKREICCNTRTMTGTLNNSL